MKLSSSASANAPRSEVPPRRRLTRKFKRADAVLPGSALALSLEGRSAPLTMTQHGWDKLYAEYKEIGE